MAHLYCDLCKAYVKDMRRHKRTQKHQRRLATAVMRASGRVPLEDIARSVESLAYKKVSAIPYVFAGMSGSRLIARDVVPQTARHRTPDGTVWCDREIEVVLRYLAESALTEKQDDIARAADMAWEAWRIIKDIEAAVEVALKSLPRYLGEDGKLNEEGRAVVAMKALEGGKRDE